MNETNPSLFGIVNSNRDFSNKDSWGKNQFNSSFPASLACYMESLGLELKYLKLDKNLKIEHNFISVKDFFKKSYSDPNLFFSFETNFLLYQKFVIGSLPRVDLVTMDKSNGQCLSGIEVKLTALPDNSTCEEEESQYGCEIVVRPDTIVYMALSIIYSYSMDKEKLEGLFQNLKRIDDWTDGNIVINHVSEMIDILDKLFLLNLDKQSPLVMQPIWKTNGKSTILNDNCLDIFIWSDFGFSQLFIDVAKKEIAKNKSKISRQVRSVIWLVKMIYDFTFEGKVNHSYVIDAMSYNTKNDKAFAVNGKITRPYIACDELVSPRVRKDQIKNIILGGGQSLLSPERRLDGIIQNSRELFE
jgi:hypothetical protein